MRLRLSVVLVVIAAALVAVPSALASSSGVVISQFRTRTAASQYDEYVQITNTTAASVDLSGWQLYDCYQLERRGSGSGPTATRCRPGRCCLPGRRSCSARTRATTPGSADATCNFQVTETGRLPACSDASGAVQDWRRRARHRRAPRARGLTSPDHRFATSRFTRKAGTAAAPTAGHRRTTLARLRRGPSGDADGTRVRRRLRRAARPRPRIDEIQGIGRDQPDRSATRCRSPGP